MLVFDFSLILFVNLWMKNLDTEINVMDIRPSVIAVAAILVASDDQLTKKTMESKMSVIPLWGSLERVSFLYF